MTMNTYTVISGDVQEITAASEERALAVYHIWQGNIDGELLPGETCSHEVGETIVLPDETPVRELLTALDHVSWILESYANQNVMGVTVDKIHNLFDAVAAIRGTVN